MARKNFRVFFNNEGKVFRNWFASLSKGDSVIVINGFGFLQNQKIESPYSLKTVEKIYKNGIVVLSDGTKWHNGGGMTGDRSLKELHQPSESLLRKVEKFDHIINVLKPQTFDQFVDLVG